MARIYSETISHIFETSPHRPFSTLYVSPEITGLEETETGTTEQIMNPFTEHTQQQGVGYWEHWGFAMGIAYRLMISVLAFAIHAMFPFITIEQDHDLEATTVFLEEQNQWIEAAKKAKRETEQPAYIASNRALTVS